MESVQFISCEDDGTDQIVSFAMPDDLTGIKSLILLRTPKFEGLLDDDERGVSVSMGTDVGDDILDRNLLEVVRYDGNHVTVETHKSKYDLDLGRVDPEEIAEMKALFERMNFDSRFRIEFV